MTSPPHRECIVTFTVMIFGAPLVQPLHTASTPDCLADLLEMTRYQTYFPTDLSLGLIYRLGFLLVNSLCSLILDFSGSGILRCSFRRGGVGGIPCRRFLARLGLRRVGGRSVGGVARCMDQSSPIFTGQTSTAHQEP